MYRRAERAFDVVFKAAANPLKHLGALGFFLLWLLVASGTVLYAVIDTSAEGAYRSIDELTGTPGSFGSALRGLHRYGTDAFLIVMFVHLAREWILGHYKRYRAYSWLTGLPLILLAFTSAIGGFWLNWDQLGQYSAIATAELLDALPGLGAPMARNFLAGTHLGDRLFTLLVFIHIGVPLLLVFGLWFHIQRIHRADVFPTKRLAIGTGLVLLTLALAWPVRSQGPANLAQAPGPLQLDWWVLFVHPLAEATSHTTVWVLVAAVLLLLGVLPFLRPQQAPPVAQVDPAHCSGCARCLADCPFAAITMIPHPNGRRGVQLPVVRAESCASCGICAGACPSSTPFRSAAVLATGIDLPHSPVDALRQRVQRELPRLKGPRRLVAVGCDCGARVDQVAGDDVLTLSLPCSGMLPPSFIDYALRSGADGVLVSACREGSCEYRLGQRWTAQRLTGEREPHLRASVERERLETAWGDAGDEPSLAAALSRLRTRCGTETAPKQSTE